MLDFAGVCLRIFAFTFFTVPGCLPSRVRFFCLDVCLHVLYVCLCPPPPPQVSEVEVNGQIEAVCESVFSEMESQAVDALDLPMPGCFRMRSHSYVRAIEKGCSQEEEEGGVAVGNRRTNSPPRNTTTVRTIQSSTGRREHGNTHEPMYF